MADFDIDAECKKLDQRAALRKKRRYKRRPSALDPYRKELLLLRRRGRTYEELTYWVCQQLSKDRAKKRKVNETTVYRFVREMEKYDG